jgi:hypothetical protein
MFQLFEPWKNYSFPPRRTQLSVILHLKKASWWRKSWTDDYDTAIWHPDHLPGVGEFDKQAKHMQNAHPIMCTCVLSFMVPSWRKFGTRLRCGGRSPRHSRWKKCGAWSCTPARVGFGAELRSIRSYELVWESRGRVAATAGVCSSKPDKIWSNSSPSKYLRGSNKGPRMLNLSIFPENSTLASVSELCLSAYVISRCTYVPRSIVLV